MPRVANIDFDNLRKLAVANASAKTIKEQLGIKSTSALKAALFELSSRDKKLYDVDFSAKRISKAVSVSKQGRISISSDFAKSFASDAGLELDAVSVRVKADPAKKTLTVIFE